MYGLTKQQRKALEFIAESTRASDGVCPTHREIAESIGRSLGATNKLIDRLVERGHLRRLPNKRRALEVVRPISAADPPPSSQTIAMRQILVRHYRACRLDDARIAALTGLSRPFIADVSGEALLPAAQLEALRAQPGVP